VHPDTAPALTYLSQTQSAETVPSVIHLSQKHANCYFFGVFSGHGLYGHKIANFAKQRIGSLVFGDESFPYNKKLALRTAVANLAIELTDCAFDATFSGCAM
jgi:hypothetical protein